MQASVEKLEHTGPAEKKRVASVLQREQLASTQSRLCQKEMEQSRQSRVSDCEGRERVKVSESCTLAREREIRARAWRIKGGLHSEGRFQGGEGGKQEQPP